MNETYIPGVCDEKHKSVNEKLGEHEKRLNNHSNRLDNLEGDNRELKTEIKNLCESMQSLVSTIKWGLGVFVTLALFVIGYFIER